MHILHAQSSSMNDKRIYGAILWLHFMSLLAYPTQVNSLTKNPNLLLSRDNFCSPIQHEIINNDETLIGNEIIISLNNSSSFGSNLRCRFSTSIGLKSQKYELINVFLTFEKWSLEGISHEKCSDRIRFSVMDPMRRINLSPKKLCQLYVPYLMNHNHPRPLPKLSIWNAGGKLVFNFGKNNSRLLQIGNRSGSYAHLVWRVPDDENGWKIRVEHYKLTQGEEDCSGDDDSYGCEIFDCDSSRRESLRRHFRKTEQPDTKDLIQNIIECGQIEKLFQSIPLLENTTTTRFKNLDGGGGGLARFFPNIPTSAPENEFLTNDNDIKFLKNYFNTYKKIDQEEEESKEDDNFKMVPIPLDEISTDLLDQVKKDDKDPYEWPSVKFPTINYDYPSSYDKSNYSGSSSAASVLLPLAIFIFIIRCYLTMGRRNRNGRIRLVEEPSTRRNNATNPRRTDGNDAPFTILTSDEAGNRSLIILSGENALVLTPRPRTEEVGRTVNEEISPPPSYESVIVDIDASSEETLPSYSDAIKSTLTVSHNV